MMRVSQWRAWVDAAPLAAPLRLIGQGGVMVIAPHPDDESLGVGGLLARAAADGRRICLVALTDGDGSHPNSRSMTPAQLAAVRRREQDKAMQALGCGDAVVERLGWRDGAGGEGADMEAAADRLAVLALSLGVTALLATAPTDTHPDHQAAARLAAAVQRRAPWLRRLSYAVWTDSRPDDDLLDLAGMWPLRTDITDMLSRKRAAIHCHESQFGGMIDDDPQGFVLPGWLVTHHLSGREVLFWHAMPGKPPGAEHFSRLYAGGNDPWGATDRPYEIDKRNHALAVLGSQPVGRAVEAGCGEGHFAAMLAEISNSVLALDGDGAIIDRAMARYGGNPRLRFATAMAPRDLPEERFDLIVLSEILYFLDEEQSVALAGWMGRCMGPGARALLVHYLGQTDTPLSGDDAADFLIANLPGWRVEKAERRPEYRIDLIERC